jgi:hypothetical protein
MRTTKRRVDLTKGMISNASPHVVPVANLDNVTCLVAGEVIVRPGFRAVAFEDAQGSSDSHQALHLYCYIHPLANWCVWMDSNGDVHAGRTPS